LEAGVGADEAADVAVAPAGGEAGGAAAAASGVCGASDQPDKAAAALAPAAAAAAADEARAPARVCAVPHHGQKFTRRGAGRPQASLMQR
jgi:hypothetical protein